MKKILFLLLLPIISFSQVSEREQKVEIRNSNQGNSNRNYVPPTLNTRPSVNEYQLKELERNRNNQTYNYKPGSNRTVILNDPYWNNWGWGWNRWNPTFGWNSYSPYFWYDNWGYRNPGRVYIYDNGKTDTIRRTRVHGNFGIQYFTNNELGGWLTFGTKTYFIMDYSRTNNNRTSVYYPSLTLDRVLPWSDRKLSDEISTNMFSVGLGKKLHKTVGVHLGLGVGREERRFRFFDEMFVLSNNGEYSFPNYKKTVFTLKLGTIVNVSRNISLKLDGDLGRGEISYGLGIKF